LLAFGSLSFGQVTFETPDSVTCVEGYESIQLLKTKTPIKFRGVINLNEHEAINSNCRLIYIKNRKRKYFIYSEKWDLNKYTGMKVKVQGTVSTIDDGSDLCITVDEIKFKKKYKE